MKNLFCLTLFLFITAPIAMANQVYTSTGKPPQLIELFTSEGCSSCPPAENWLNNLKSHEGLWTDYVPLAFHVDYWDWIGWTDRFASAEHSERQRKYAQNRQVNSVYTPGFVVAGEEWRGFFGRQELPKNTQKPAGKLSLSVVDMQFDLSFEGNVSETGVAHIAILGMGIETPVKRGENAGRKLVHDFVVLDWQTLPAGQNQWTGTFGENWKHGNKQYAIAAWVEHPDKTFPLQVVAGYLENP